MTLTRQVGQRRDWDRVAEHESYADSQVDINRGRNVGTPMIEVR